jgi:uncharacterized small protein (TIGR04563 family)
MNPTDHCKQSLYMNEEMLVEVKREAIRLDRSYSWILQMAWKIAKEQIQSMPVQGPL